MSTEKRVVMLVCYYQYKGRLKEGGQLAESYGYREGDSSDATY